MSANDPPPSAHPRFPQRILTLNRNDPVPTEENQETNPLLKKKIISYPLPKVEEHVIPVNEYRNMLQTEHRYRQQIQAQQTIDEIADFERRNFGKAKVPKPIHVEPLDAITRQTLDQFKPPLEASKFDYAVPKVRARTVLSNERVITRPPAWNMLDEPMMPAKQPTDAPSMQHAVPFAVPAISKETKYGIPIYNKYILKTNKKKMGQFESKLRYIYTCDNQVKEEALKTRVLEDRNNLIMKREKQMAKCAELGQKWAMKLNGSLPRKPKVVRETPISQEDLDALNFLKDRDEQLLSLYKNNKKEMQTQEIASLQQVHAPRL